MLLLNIVDNMFKFKAILFGSRELQVSGGSFN